MHDVLDPLRAIADAPLPGPEPVEELRRRTARRRRRQRVGLVPLGVVLAVVTVALAVGHGTGDGPHRGVRTIDRPEVSTPTTTDDPDVATTIATDEGTDDEATALVPASPPSVPIDSPRPTGPLSLDELTGRPTSYVRLVYSDQGIDLLDLGPLPPRRVTDQPTRRAFLTYHAVVAQLGDGAGDFGPIVVFDDEGQRELVPANPPQQGGIVQLHDLQYLDGRQVAVFTQSQGAGGQDWEERLFLVDILTGERRDLGEVGGWEVGVSHALLTDAGVVVLVSHLIGHDLELRRFDGSTAWKVTDDAAAWDDDLDEPRARSLMRFGTTPTEIHVLEPSRDAVGSPHLVVRRFDPSTGDVLEPQEISMSVDPGIEVGAFCRFPENASQLLCDNSAGPPIGIDLPSPYGGGTGHGRISLQLDEPTRGTTTLFRYDDG